MKLNPFLRGGFSALILFPLALFAQTVIHFESPEPAEAQWVATRANEPAEEPGILSTTRLEGGKRAAGLKIQKSFDTEVFRIAKRKADLYLHPATEYELTITLRILSRSPEGKAIFDGYLTDLRWQWQTPKINCLAATEEWTTLKVTFTTPEHLASKTFRPRFDVRNLEVDAEIAEITVTEKSAEKEPPSQAMNNLIPNPAFRTDPSGRPEGWLVHPDGTALIKVTPAPEAPVLSMEAGAAVLGVHSDFIKVEPGATYSLIFEQKQENIHIGFSMGGRSQIRWFSDLKGGPQVLFLDLLDGSFDWRRIAYSVVAPPDARYAKVLFTKTGSPGKVSFRNVQFVKGTFKKAKEELTLKDLENDQLAHGFLIRQLEFFMADKPGVGEARLRADRKALESRIEAARQDILADARRRPKALSPDEKAEVLWVEMLKGRMGFQVRPDSPYYAGWKPLADQVDAFKTEVNRWLAVHNPGRLRTATKRDFGAFKGFGVAVDSPMLKVLRDRPYAGIPGKAASIAMARNEEESAQIVLTALDREVGEITVEVSPLADARGHSGTQPSVALNRVDYVKTRQPQYQTDALAWWPDILAPEPRAAAVCKGENQSFWLTVSTAADTPPGRYVGTVSIKENGVEQYRFPLEVEVWGITLPRPGKFKVVGRFSPEQLKHYYRWPEMKDDVVANWNRYIFKKRWNSTDPFASGLTPNGPALKAALREGVNSLNLLNISQLMKQDRSSRTYQWPDAADEAKMKEALRKAVADFREAGGSDSTALYLFGFDEQHDPGQYPIMSHVFGLAKQEVPGIRTVTTTTYSPLRELVGKVDIWVPLLGLDTAELRERQVAGDELFFYIYGHPFHPFPNASLIDYPGIDGRITFWMASQRGYTGFLHWLMNGWKENYEGTIRKPGVDWDPLRLMRNGEGSFLYPGANQEPMSSIRFELVRDGIEDWELLNLLKEAVHARTKAGGETPRQAAAALEQAAALVPALDRYSLDPAALMKARRAVAEALIALQESQPPLTASTHP